MWRQSVTRASGWLQRSLRGAASILDLGAVLGPRLEDLPWLDPDPRVADRNALRGDWQAVERDLVQAWTEVTGQRPGWYHSADPDTRG